MLSEMELRVLKDIQKALKVPHLAQQALSSERTPTLSSVLRAYDLSIRGWELLASSLPNLKHAISAGLEKIRKYEQKSRQNQMFVLAIALNPSMKLKWIEDKWGGTEAPAARMSLYSAMLSYRRNARQAACGVGAPVTAQRSTASIASSATVVEEATR